MCGPHRRFAPLLPRTLRRILQAVSTVATQSVWDSTVQECDVSIPQAVSTVASSPLFSLPFGQGLEMCGPHRRFAPLLPRTLRRIPQAVSTVATNEKGVIDQVIPAGFNTASGKHCCNLLVNGHAVVDTRAGFNTASGKHCCNLSSNADNSIIRKFQYRKR